MSKPESQKPTNTWDTAIADAEKGIRDAQAKIRTLKKSIATFQRLRDCGEPFPGEGAEETEAQG